MVGTEAEVIDFMEWFCALPYKHKVFIAGNHDDCLFGADINGLPENCHYLYRLALIQALAKTGHDEQAIDMATQIGVDQVVPWQADRSIAKWKVGRTDKKWNSVLDAATEQSRRAFKPQLEACASSKEVVAICRRACVHGDVVIVLHQDATDTWSGVEEKVAQLVERTLQDGRPRTVSVVVGPEGGISEQEVADFVKAGAVSCVLGRNILRAATAGPVALSLLSRVLGRYE